MQTTKNDSAVEAAGTAAAATATTVATATTATPDATPVVGTTAAVAQGEPDGAELENFALGGMLQAQRDEDDICQGRVSCKDASTIENALINEMFRGEDNDYKTCMNEE